MDMFVSPSCVFLPSTHLLALLIQGLPNQQFKGLLIRVEGTFNNFTLCFNLWER